MVKKKFMGIIVCCENNRSMNEALAIKQFFDDLNINIKINYNCLEGCVANNQKNCFLICLSNDIAITPKKIKSVGDLNEKERKDYNSQTKFVGKFAIGMIANTHKSMVIDMNLIKKVLDIAVDCVIHELLHLERKGHCNNKTCMAYGYNLKLEVGSNPLCNNCKKLFEKIIDKYFVKKTRGLEK